MVKRTEAYVDTGAFIAFVDRSDSYHHRFRRLFSDPPPLVTTTLVVAEGHGWFLKRYDRVRARQFLALIDDLEPLQLHAVGAAEYAGGAKMLRKYADQDLTLTDAIGLHLMKERTIRTCWATDFHLGLAGASLVVNEP
jgi:predicted nucleic acid-binding protein